MERSEFRLRMDQFKQARESNPLLSYWEWKNSLPDNLAHTPDWQYNNFGAYTGGLKPELNEDGYYHLGSRNPYTGEILKPKSHPTYDKAILNDAAAGYFPYEKNGITYTKTYSPTGDISGYANGTDYVSNKKYIIDKTNYNDLTDSPYEDVKIEDKFKPRFELRKEKVNYYSKPFVKFFKNAGNVLRTLGPVSTFIENVFPSEDAETIDDLRMKMKESESRINKVNVYADGTDGIKYYGAYSPKQQAYVLPVYDDKGENNVVLPEVTVTPLNNTDLAGYMQKGDFIKEAMSFTPVGDVEDIYNIGKDIYNKNYALAALGAGLFFLPDIVAKPISRGIRKISKVYNSEKRLSKLIDNIYATKTNVRDAHQQYVNNFNDMYDDVIRQETELLKLKYPETVKKSIGRITLEQFAESYNKAKRLNDAASSYIIPWEYRDNELYLRLYRDDRDYLQFAKNNNLPFDKLSTVDKWIDKQRRAIRGVYSDKPNATIDELEPMFTKVKDLNIGGDRLRTSGGLYVSNSMDIADRFSRSLDDTPGTAAYAILQLPDIDRTLPIEQQLSSLRRRILPYDVLNTHLNFDPESLMNLGYIGVLAKYATRSGQRLPAYETALFGKPGDEPITILDVHTSADTKNMHGRWGAYAGATDELYSPRYIGESYGDFIHDAKAYYNMLPEYYKNEMRDVPNPIFLKRKDKITEELYKLKNDEYDKMTQRILTLDDRLQRLSNIKTFDKDNFKSIAIPTTIGAGLLGTITGYGIRENNERNNYIQLMQQQGISPDLLDDRMFKSYYLTKKRNSKKALDILQKQIKTLKNESN